MSAIANIALADAQATPVTQTFNPVGANGSMDGSSAAVWMNRVSGISVAFERIELSTSMASKNRPTNKVVLKLRRPVLETISGSTVAGTTPAPSVAYVPMAEVTFVFPERTTLEQRKSLRKMLAAALADTQVLGAIENFDNPI